MRYVPYGIHPSPFPYDNVYLTDTFSSRIAFT